MIPVLLNCVAVGHLPDARQVTGTGVRGAGEWGKGRTLAALGITVAPRVLMFRTLEMALEKARKPSCGTE